MDTPDKVEATRSLARRVLKALLVRRALLANPDLLDNPVNPRPRKILALAPPVPLDSRVPPDRPDPLDNLGNPVALAPPARRDRMANLVPLATTASREPLASRDRTETRERREFAPSTAPSTAASSSRTALAGVKRVASGPQVERLAAFPGHSLLFISVLFIQTAIQPLLEPHRRLSARKGVFVRHPVQ
jgi:hypothetical protein